MLLRRFLGRFSHFAHVRDPHELRMGSPQFGELILDGKPMAKAIECESLTWSRDRRLLAVQQLVSDHDGPKTRVVVIDTEQRTELVATAAVAGFSNPVRFEDDALVYRHWHHQRGERELRLPLPQERLPAS